VVDPGLWWLYPPLDMEKQNGQDLWDAICTSADSSTLTTGTEMQDTSLSTTSTSSTFPNGSPFWDASDPLFLPTSTERSELWNGEDPASGYVTLSTILEESYFEADSG